MPGHKEVAAPMPAALIVAAAAVSAGPLFVVVATASACTLDTALYQALLYSRTSLCRAVGTALWYQSFVVTAPQPQAELSTDADTWSPAWSAALSMAERMVW